MKMSKPSPEMLAAVDSDLDSIMAKETMVAGIMPSDDGPPPAVLFLVRTHDGKINAVVMLSASHVAEMAHGLLAASKEVFGTDEHEESKERPSN